MSADRPFARPPMSAEPSAFPPPGEGPVRPAYPLEEPVAYPAPGAAPEGARGDEPVSGPSWGAGGESGTTDSWQPDGTGGGFYDDVNEMPAARTSTWPERQSGDTPGAGEDAGDEPEPYRVPEPPTFGGVPSGSAGSGEDDSDKPPARVTPLEGMNEEDRKKFDAAADRVAQAKRKLENEAGAKWRRVRRKKHHDATHRQEMVDAQTELHDVLKAYADAENLDSGERIELSVQALDSVLERQVALADPAKRKMFAGLRDRIARVSGKRWFKIGVPALIVTAAITTGILTGGLAAGGFAAVGLGAAGGGAKGWLVGSGVGKLQARGVRKELNTREATRARTRTQRGRIMNAADMAAHSPGMLEEHEAFGRAMHRSLYGAAEYERRENISDRRFKVRKAAGRGALYGAILGGAGALAGGYNMMPWAGGDEAGEVTNTAGGSEGHAVTGHRFIPGAGETSPTPTAEGTEGTTISPTHGGSGNQGFKSFDSPSASTTDSPYQGIPRTGDVNPTDSPYQGIPRTGDVVTPDNSAGNQGVPKGDTTPTPGATSQAPESTPTPNTTTTPSGTPSPEATTTPTPEATSKPPFAPEGNDHGSPSKPDGGATAPNTTPGTTPENPAIANAQINSAQEKIIEGMLQNDPDKLSKVTGFENFTPEADTKAAAANFKNGNTLWDKTAGTDTEKWNTIVGNGTNKGGIEELSAKGFKTEMGGGAKLVDGNLKFTSDTWWVENMKTPDGGSYVTMPNGDTFFYDGSLSQTEQAALLDQLSKGGEIVSPEDMAEKMAAQIPDTPQDLENMGGTIVDQFNTDLTTEIDKSVDPNETNPEVITGQKMNAIESFIAEHKQTLGDLPEDLRNDIVNKIAQANNVPPEEVKKLMDEAFKTATTANSSR